MVAVKKYHRVHNIIYRLPLHTLMPTFPLTFASIQFFARGRILGVAIPPCLETTFCQPLTKSANCSHHYKYYFGYYTKIMVNNLPIENKIYFNIQNNILIPIYIYIFILLHLILIFSYIYIFRFFIGSLLFVCFRLCCST